MQNDFLSKFKLLVQTSNSIVIVPSARLDLDAVCSAQMMKEVVEKFNDSAFVQIYADFQIDEYHKFIVTEEFHCLTESKFDLSNFDLAVIVDGREPKHLLKTNKDKNIKLPKKVVTFDHHKTSKELGEFDVIDTSFASATEIIFSTLEMIKFSEAYYSNAFCGLLSDSGNLRWATNAKNYEDFYKLSQLTSRCSWIVDNYYKFLNRSELEVKYKIQKLMKYDLEYKIDYLKISLSDLKKLKIEKSVFDSVKDILIFEYQSLRDFEFSVTIVESLNRYIFVSMRADSQNEIDVAEIAKVIANSFQNGEGGGHKKAAGASFPSEDFEVDSEKVLNIIRESLKNK